MQRKGIWFDRALNRELVDLIQNHDERVRFVEKQSRRVSVWDVDVSGSLCRVVYDAKRENIVTVLPGQF